MGVGEVSRAGVLAALGECRAVGREAFDRQYAASRVAAYELVHDGARFSPWAVLAAAHVFSTGQPATDENGFNGGEHAVVSRLRELGFVVNAAQPMPQLVLQPRGGARDRGPQNFDKSVRRGIPFEDLRGILGSRAAEIGALCPDGIVRLWGSTPTEQTSNEKAKALAGRRVGDHVLFYARHAFFARATVLLLLDSAAVAEAVWGKDESDATWEHIMVLGGVEEFLAPVPAPPLLEALDVAVPLRSLTLRSAEAYREAAHLVRSEAGDIGLAARPGLGSTALSSGGLLERLRSLRVHRNPHTGTPSRHQPLTLLWAVGRVSAGLPRLAPWSSFRAEVGPLLAEFGREQSKITPEYPFWYLQRSGLWEVYGVGEDDEGFTPSVAALDAGHPVAGLTKPATELLQDESIRVAALEILVNRYLPELDHRALLTRVGLGGYRTAGSLPEAAGDEPGDDGPGTESSDDPAPRRERTTSTVQRDGRLVARVKELHDNACQICGDRLRYNGRPYSQAAHIRGLGSPHNGPDALTNLLCLCPNHHVLFDGLAIYIAEDRSVRWVEDGTRLASLRLHPEHRIDDAHLRYHRTLCLLTR